MRPAVHPRDSAMSGPQDPLTIVYSWPHCSDRLAMQLLGIRERQLRKLVTARVLTRIGLPRNHRIECISILRRLGMPINQPPDLTPWREMVDRANVGTKWY